MEKEFASHLELEAEEQRAKRSVGRGSALRRPTSIRKYNADERADARSVGRKFEFDARMQGGVTFLAIEGVTGAGGPELEAIGTQATVATAVK